METIRRWSVLAAMAAMLALGGCGDGEGDPLTCAQLGYTCGVDGAGNSCGSCPGGQTCGGGGRCGAPPCTLRVFDSCGGGGCCGTTPGGSPTICSTITSGPTYCAPSCATDEYCDSLAATSGVWVCGVRGDGLRVCIPR